MSTQLYTKFVEIQISHERVTKIVIGESLQQSETID